MKVFLTTFVLVMTLTAAAFACPSGVPIERVGLDWFLVNQHPNFCIKQPAQRNVWWKNKWICRMDDDLYYDLYEADDGVGYSFTSAVEHTGAGKLVAAFQYSCNCSWCAAQ